MRHYLRSVLVLLLVAIAAVAIPSRSYAQNPPSGAIFDLSTVHPGALSPTTYQQFTTSFVANASSEYVSFAFREAPAYFGFDDACVTSTACASQNLLSDPGFESDTPANVNTNFPIGWYRWIQPVDTAAIGVVAGPGDYYGCGEGGPHTGSYFWCDGSVQGYDALYQQLNGLAAGTTYTVSWYLTDDSGDPITNPSIDMLVYAGDELPTGSEPIGTTPTPTVPEPGTFLMFGTGMVGIVRVVRARYGRKV